MTLLHINIGFWIGMGLVAAAVAGFVCAAWLLPPPKRGRRS